jgi:hypothetical protein
MNKKEIKTKVHEQLSAGKLKSEVYSELSAQGADKKQLAFIIASYANPDLCESQKTHINILIVIMCMQALIGLITGFVAGSEIGSNAKFIVGFIGLSIPLLFAWGFYTNRVGAYTAYIFLTLIQFPKTLAGLSSNPTATAIIALINFCILVYVWYIRGKIFPDFAFAGPKKINGEYVFSAG